MSAALNFGRGLKQTLVIDAGEQRHRVTEVIEGMFAKMNWDTQFDILETLDPERRDDGGLRTNPLGETSIHSLFAVGEAKTDVSSQLINAAANRAGMAKIMMIDLINEDF